MTVRIWTIVQARTGSSRLPGKVLKPFGPYPTMLDAVISRVALTRYPFVVAIPHRDNRLAALCIKRGWMYVEGWEHDVLDRYVRAAEAVRADHIIRVTADCPFLDVEAAQWTVLSHLESGADFTHYKAEGRAVEVFTRETLLRCHADSDSAWEREHISEHVLNHPDKFHIVQVKFSVDTQEDLERARRRAEWWQ